MNAKVSQPVGLHSQRVAAWVYTVINPLIEAFRLESKFLAAGNLTWRSYNKRCEYIRPVHNHLKDAYLPNYEDFLAENVRFKKLFQEHDDVLAEAEDKANKTLEILINSPLFKKEVMQALTEYDRQTRNSRINYPTLDGPMKNDLPKYVAEFLINNVTSLPSHWAHHKFWQDFAAEFAFYTHRKSFISLRSATKNLLRICENLTETLLSHRLELCRTCDIPAAPLSPTPKPDAETFSF